MEPKINVPAPCIARVGLLATRARPVAKTGPTDSAFATSSGATAETAMPESPQVPTSNPPPCSARCGTGPPTSRSSFSHLSSNQRPFLATLVILTSFTLVTFVNRPSFADLHTPRVQSAELPETVDRKSPSYRDYDTRFRKSAKDDSIAILLMHDLLRSRNSDPDQILGLLDDHRERVTGIDTFRKGRHSVTFQPEFQGELGTSKFFDTFFKLNTSAGASLDIEVIRNGRQPIALSGRLARQTGHDYVIGDPQVIPKACAGIRGGIAIPGGAVGKVNADTGAKVCYQYDPSTMTALGAYVANNQDRLARLETFGGPELDRMIDRFYAEFAIDCDPSHPTVNTQCGKLTRYLNRFHDAGLGRSLPTRVRSVKEVRAAILEDPSVAVLIEEHIKDREHVNGVEKRLGRRLTTLETLVVQLDARFEDAGEALVDAHVRLFKDGTALDYFNDPATRERFMMTAVVKAQAEMRQQERELRAYLADSQYAALSPEQRRLKFPIDLEAIRQDHAHVQAYTEAARNTLLLVGALAGDQKFQGRVDRLFVALTAASELVRTARILQTASQAEELANLTTMTAYANGVGATLALVSLVSGTQQKSEMQVLLEYFDQRLDVIDEKIDWLVKTAGNMDRKIDAVLRGQQAVLQKMTTNARSIRVNWVEARLIRRSLRNVLTGLTRLTGNIGSQLDEAAEHRAVIFDAELRIAQQQAVRSADEVIGHWLNPDSGIIERLNAKTLDRELVDRVQADRQVVLEVLDALTGPEFVVPRSILIKDKDLFLRSPAHSLAMLSEFADEADRISSFYRTLHTAGVSDLSAATQVNKRQIHKMAFPPIAREAFVGLPNPDAFAYVLKRYLTFALALDKRGRARVGFGNFPKISRIVDRLVESTSEARKASVVLLGGVIRELGVISGELTKGLTEGQLLDLTEAEARKLLDDDGDGERAEHKGSGHAAHERNRLEAALRGPIVGVKDEDVVALVSAFKTDRRLLELARREGLVRYVLTQTNEPADVNGGAPGISLAYAIVEHYDYRKGTVKAKSTQKILGVRVGSSEASVKYRCKGARIRRVVDRPETRRWPTGYAFPLDLTDGDWVALSSTMKTALSNAIIRCVKAAKEDDLVVPHRKPSKEYTGWEFWKLSLAEDVITEKFYRKTALVGHETKLWHRGWTRCKVQAEWEPSLGHLANVDLASPLGTVAKYVVHTLDQPFAYQSADVVKKENERLHAEDGTPKTESFKHKCSFQGLQATFEMHPGPPELGSARPALILRKEWVEVPETEQQIPPGFRRGVESALLARRNIRKAQALSEVGRSFRNPTSELEHSLKKLDLSEISEGVRKTLLRKFKDDGAEGLATHPMWRTVIKRYPSSREELARAVRYGSLRTKAVSLLKVFAHWGWGACLESVPEYRETFGVADRVDSRVGMTTLEAITTLGDPGAVDKYPVAAATLISAQSRLEKLRASNVNFPPVPRTEEGRAYFSSEYWGIDHKATAEIAAVVGCRPGHGSIKRLEDYQSLMVQSELVAQ